MASLKGKGVDARAIELKPTVRHDMMELLFQDPDVVKALQP